MADMSEKTFILIRELAQSVLYRANELSLSNGEVLDALGMIVRTIADTVFDTTPINQNPDTIVDALMIYVGKSAKLCNLLPREVLQ